MDIRSVTTRARTTRVIATSIALVALAAAAFPGVQSTHAARPAVKATINIGTKNFAEEYILTDMYQLLLQRAGFAVKIHDLGTTPILQKALRRGDIDLYPEYTGTGLVVVLNKPAIANAGKAYNVVKAAYAKKFNLTWLQQSPFNDTNGVAVTQATAHKYGLHSLTDLAKVASKLSFAGYPECADRPDCLGGMKDKYGINFKQVIKLGTAPLIYKGLSTGQFDVAEVFTTDGPIRALHLVVLTDPKGIFPADHIAPVVRATILKKYPEIATTLNKLPRYLTTAAMIRLNGLVILQSKNPMAVARQFLKSKHLI